MNRWKKASDAYKKVSPPGEKTGETPEKKEGKQAKEKKASGTAIPPGLLKTEGGGVKGWEKAAKFFLLLGKEEASKVFNHLGEKEIEGIAREIARIQQIDGEEAKALLDEFGIIKDGNVGVTGGVETARAILNRAFGKERSDAIINKAVPHGGEKPFAFLDDLEVHQLLLLLKEEPDHVLSMVLVYLDPKKASQVLDQLDPQRAKEVVKRIALLKKIDPQVLSAVQNSLRERMKQQGKVVTRELDGKSALAQILRHSDPFTEEAILKDLGQADPDLSEEVKERLYTIDIVLNIDDKTFQKLLRDFSDSEIATIMKGQEERIREKFLSNLSERRRILVREESVHLGYMRKSEVGKTVKEFIEYLRDKEEEGSLVIFRENDYVT